MNNVFNKAQILKSSEDYKKFSKSVSYETLVGGTATIGRGIKQTRRLSKGSADKPLSAVGTLTSLLCNSAKVVEKLLRHVITRRTSVRRGYLPEQGTHANEESLFASVTCFMRLPRRIQRLLLVMTIPALAFLLFFNLSTAFADCSCSWGGADGNTLTISNCSGGQLSSSSCAGQKTVNNVIIGAGVTSIGTWAFSDAKSLTSITIPEGVTSIGIGAFWGATGLTSITIPDSVTDIGAWAFLGAKSLTSITIPEKVTGIGVAAFQNAESLTSITIPDNINTAGWRAEVFQNLPANTDIVCLGDEEKCKQKLAKYIPKDKGENCTNSDFCIKKEIQPALFDSCTSTNYFWDGSTCIREPDVTKRKCCTSCKDMGGFCNRIRYTPAEAAKVLKDENNEIVITFRK